jgi:hypothetical protein
MLWPFNFDCRLGCGIYQNFDVHLWQTQSEMGMTSRVAVCGKSNF